jgi:hypothetical protein
MPPCICGCPAAWHLNYSDCCLNWHTDGCMCFHPDNGSDLGTLSVDHRVDPYEGQYGTDRKWAL